MNLSLSQTLPNFLSGTMSIIPTDLHRDILIHMPVETLFRFRSVCKNWLCIIDDPIFAKLHLHLHCNGESGEGQIILRYDYSKLYSFPMRLLDFSERNTKTIDATNIKNLTRRRLPNIPYLPLPSCHGLILISNLEKNRVWSLWNPFTKETLEFPGRDNFVGYNSMSLPSFGLGYDVTTDDYKVVSIAQQYGYFPTRIWLETLVYSLKLGNWKKIQDFQNCYAPHGGNGIFLNGALHWITSLNHSEDLIIIALDLGTENYSLIPLPSALSEAKRDFFADRLFLDVMGKSLFVSCHYERRRFEVWMMNDNGRQKRWVKLFSTEREMVAPRFVAYLKSKEQLLIQYDKDSVLWYDVKKRSTKSFVINGEYSNFISQVFQPSLFRLKNIGDVDVSTDVRETKNRKRKRGAADRLELRLKSIDD